MALERKDAVADTSATTGTGTLTLTGVAVTGFVAFTGVVSDAATVRFRIQNADNTEWEVTSGIYTAATKLLTRGTPVRSSNAGALVNFGAGTKAVVVVVTAADVNPPGATGQLAYNDGANALAGAAGLTTDGSVLTNTQAVAATSTDGVVLATSTAATLGVQSYSPRVRMKGSGRATGPANSQAVEFITEVQPVQGVTNPTGNLVIAVSINGAAYVVVATLSSAGALTFPTLSVTGSGNSASFGGNLTATGGFTGANGFSAFTGGNGVQVQVGRASSGHTGGVALMTGSDGLCEVISAAATYKDLRLRAHWMGTYLTVATLPVASSYEGYEVSVNDSLAPVAGSAVAAGGAAKCKVRSNGAAWNVLQVF